MKSHEKLQIKWWCTESFSYKVQSKFMLIHHIRLKVVEIQEFQTSEWLWFVFSCRVQSILFIKSEYGSSISMLLSSRSTLFLAIEHLILLRSKYFEQNKTAPPKLLRVETGSLKRSSPNLSGAVWVNQSYLFRSTLSGAVSGVQFL